MVGPDISQFLNESSPLSPPHTSQPSLHTTPIIPPYTTFSHTPYVTISSPSTLLRTYSMGNNILTR